LHETPTYLYLPDPLAQAFVPPPNDPAYNISQPPYEDPAYASKGYPPPNFGNNQNYFNQASMYYDPYYYGQVPQYPPQPQGMIPPQAAGQNYYIQNTMPTGGPGMNPGNFEQYPPPKDNKWMNPGFMNANREMTPINESPNPMDSASGGNFYGGNNNNNYWVANPQGGMQSIGGDTPMTETANTPLGVYNPGNAPFYTPFQQNTFQSPFQQNYYFGDPSSHHNRHHKKKSKCKFSD
jgi:hypothetical protein